MVTHPSEAGIDYTSVHELVAGRTGSVVLLARGGAEAAGGLGGVERSLTRGHRPGAASAKPSEDN
jgi:hypothetical protein